MSNENGFQMVDNALSIAVSQLVDKGLPQDEAYIALLLRLKHLNQRNSASSRFTE